MHIRFGWLLLVLVTSDYYIIYIHLNNIHIGMDGVSNKYLELLRISNFSSLISIKKKANKRKKKELWN
jgi:hypothetical protein